MLTYATLDAIADAYTPVLAVSSLTITAIAAFRSRWQSCRVRAAALLWVLCVAYGLMFADKALGLWAHWGLDYSTHTATAMGLVIFLSYCAPRGWVVLAISMALYALLMLYQRYHTVMDIVTTACVVAPLIAMALMRWRKHLADEVDIPSVAKSHP